MKNYFLILLMALGLSAIIFGSCSKDEEPGVDGDDGTKIHSGTVDPVNTFGNIGDFYINLSTGSLFGPKTDNGWGVGFVLKPEDGTDGIDGATVLNGENAPASTIGNVGDFYIDTQALVIYGPKDDGGWGDGVSLRNDEYYGVQAYSILAKFIDYYDGQNYQSTYPNLQMVTDSYNLPFIYSSAVLGVYVSVEGTFGLSDDFGREIYNGDFEDLSQVPTWVDINKIHESYFNFFRFGGRTGIGEMKFYYKTYGTTGGAGVNDSIRFHFKSGPTYSNPQGQEGHIEADRDFVGDSIKIAMHVKYIPQKEYQIISKKHPNVEHFLRIK